MKIIHMDIRLLTINFDSCFRFYRDTMGFQHLWGELGGTYASFLIKPGISLALYKRELMAEAVKRTSFSTSSSSQDNFALILEVKDIETRVDELREKGVVFINETHDRPDWGIRVAHFRDPDGNLIELNTPLPKEEWSNELRSEDEKYKT